MEALRKLGALSPFFSYPETTPDLKILEALGVVDESIPHLRLLELQNEYVRLFINSMPEVPCPPYGSVYLEGRCMGESTVELLELYQKYGLTTDEMPDHIAVELEFLFYLHHLLERGEAVESDLARILEHLDSWVPVFFKRIEEHDRTGFYSALARTAGSALSSHNI